MHTPKACEARQGDKNHPSRRIFPEPVVDPFCRKSHTFNRLTSLRMNDSDGCRRCFRNHGSRAAPTHDRPATPDAASLLKTRKVGRLLPATVKGVWEMIKGKLSIFILSLALIGAANSAWAQREPTTTTTTPTIRVPEPVTSLLLLTGVAGGALAHRLRRRGEGRRKG